MRYGPQVSMPVSNRHRLIVARHRRRVTGAAVLASLETLEALTDE
jgi:hypothetical protein